MERTTSLYISSQKVLHESMTRTPVAGSSVRPSSRTGKLSDRSMSRVDAGNIVQRRSKDAGLETTIGNHSFRTIGLTDYMDNSGDITVVQRMLKTAQIYHCREDEMSSQRDQAGDLNIKNYFFSPAAFCLARSRACPSSWPRIQGISWVPSAFA